MIISESSLRNREEALRNINPLQCEYTECNYTNVDLVTCDICGKWVCEECNEVAVSKLKPLMSKCKTLYFICKGCNEMSHDDNIKEILADTTEVHSVDEKRNNADLVKSLKTPFDKKITEMESKLERLIDIKLDKKINATNLYNENIEEQESVSATTTQENKKYSDIIKGPMDFRQIMQEARNEEKVEERKRRDRRISLYMVWKKMARLTA